jgi:cell division GTPase FtsZ
MLAQPAPPKRKFLSLLLHGIKAISDLFTVPGLINLDLADLRTVIAEAGGTIHSYLWDKKGVLNV